MKPHARKSPRLLAAISGMLLVALALIAPFGSLSASAQSKAPEPICLDEIQLAEDQAPIAAGSNVVRWIVHDWAWNFLTYDPPVGAYSQNWFYLLPSPGCGAYYCIGFVTDGSIIFSNYWGGGTLLYKGAVLFTGSSSCGYGGQTFSGCMPDTNVNIPPVSVGLEGPLCVDLQILTPVI